MQSVFILQYQRMQSVCILQYQRMQSVRNEYGVNRASTLPSLQGEGLGVGSVYSHFLI